MTFLLTLGILVGLAAHTLWRQYAEDVFRRPQ